MNFKYRIYAIIVEKGKEERTEEVAGKRKCYMDSCVEITDSKIYVLWLAK